MPVKQFVVNAFVRRLELLDSSNKNRILRSAEVLTNVILFPGWSPNDIPLTEQQLFVELDRLRDGDGHITTEVTDALVSAGAVVIKAKYLSEGGDAELTGYRVEDTIYWDTRGKSTPIQSREFFTGEWWDEEVVLSEPTKSAMYAKQSLGRTQRPLTDIEINVLGEDGTELTAVTWYDKIKQLSEGDLIFIKEQVKGTLTRIDRVDLYEEFLQQLE